MLLTTLIAATATCRLHVLNDGSLNDRLWLDENRHSVRYRYKVLNLPCSTVSLMTVATITTVSVSTIPITLLRI